MKSSIIYLMLILLASTYVYADELSVFVDVKSIESKTDEPFYDDSIDLDIDADGSLDSTLHFSYSKSGPPPACIDIDDCKITNHPVITSYIDIFKKRIHINFMCSSIGFYSKKTNGLRDMHCGPDLRLRWNGKNYTEQ